MTLRSQFARDHDKNPPPIEDAQAYFGRLGIPEKVLCKVRSSDPRLRPWFTLVLGSGCSSDDGLEAALQSLKGSLVARVKELPPPGGLADVTVAQRVERFCSDLIDDRFRSPSRRVKEGANGQAAGVEPHINGGVAYVFAAAALLTPLYHYFKALGDNAPRRAGHDDVATLEWVAVQWASRDLALTVNYLTPFRVAIDQVEVSAGEIAASLRPDDDQETERPVISERVVALAQSLKANLNTDQPQAKIKHSDLTSLTELAWLCLATTALEDLGDAAPTSAGWSDLLVDLDFRHEGRLGVPLLSTLGEGRELLSGRFRMPQEPGMLHQAAAELLVAQGTLRTAKSYKAHGGAEPGWPPVAVAYVTSFDLDLELALLRSGVAFTVALPVYVVNDKQQVAHGCWLAFNVPGTGNPERENQDGWEGRFKDGTQKMFVLKDVEDLVGPIVVRLAGCPFVSLPRLKDDPDLREALAGAEGTIVAALTEEAAWLSGTHDADDQNARESALEGIRLSLRLEPAVLLSEHDAMFQSAMDLISEPTTPVCGLPACLAAGRRGWFRFWVLLGVQVRDAAIRHRLVALLSSLPRTTLDLGSSATQQGVAVNAHVSDIEQTLLAWNGLHVVQDDVVAFVPQLTHYAAHLDQGGLFSPDECYAIRPNPTDQQT